MPGKKVPEWLANSTVEPLNDDQKDLSSQAAASAVVESSAVEPVKPSDTSTKVKADNRTAKRHFGKTLEVIHMLLTE